ncbi:MAG TPA: nucleoside phosphorylase [Ktedonosporobacter sp.]|jgi:uridine phosphorylase|nr:nucleoside phosphorylase [Ktedonosporobacter sp.]
MEQDYPILEYDNTPEAIIEPKHLLKPIDIAEHAVACFFQDIITQLSQKHTMHVVKRLRSEIGTNPVYEIEFQGRRLTVFHPGVGGPLTAAVLEEVIALGCRKFIACGGAGVLNGDLALGHIVVPTAAIRDEGTSYHYLPPAREVPASAEGVAAIERVLQEHHCDYVLGKTWTTDAIYRETAAKVQQRRAEGCLTVEMEAASFFAVAQFRNVQFAQMLYGGDDLSGEQWDSRHWDKHTSVREKLFWLAAEACLLL